MVGLLAESVEGVTASWAGVGVAVCGIVGAFVGGAGLTKLLDYLSKRRVDQYQQDNKRRTDQYEQENRTRGDAIVNLQSYVERLERQLNRLEADASEKQIVINRLRDIHEECRVENTALRAHINFMCNVMTRQNQQLRERGITVEEIPHMPLPPSPAAGDANAAEADFLQRASMQNTATVKTLGERVSEQKPNDTKQGQGGKA